MDDNPQEFVVAVQKAELRSREAHLSWVRIIISILTPSLVLLIGLQDKNPELTGEQVFFLVASIALMSVTILLGLLVLHSESRGQHLLRDNIIHQLNTEKGSLDQSGIILPHIYLYAERAFSFCTPLAIMFLAIYGILKYIT